MILTRQGWSRFKGCARCRSGAIRSYDLPLSSKEVELILDPKEMWKRIVERHRNRETNIDSIAFRRKSE